jgi:putative solute:sodium symporter small subunit
MSSSRQTRFWRHARRLTAGLLLVWLALSLGVPWFASTLDGVHVAGFPLGYWLAAQGALVGFLLIVVVYVICMDRAEADCLAIRQSASAAANDPSPSSAQSP